MTNVMPPARPELHPCRPMLRVCRLFAVASVLLLASCSDDNPSAPPPSDNRAPVWFPLTRIVTDEGRGSLRIPIFHHGGGGHVMVRVAGGTAEEGVDFEIEHNASMSGFAEGDTLAWAVLSIHQDAQTEPTENILLELADPDSSHVVAQPARTEVVLVEDDYGGPHEAISWPLQVGRSWSYQAWTSTSYAGFHRFFRLTTLEAAVSGLVTFHGDTYSVLSFPLEGGTTLLLRQDGQVVRGAHGAECLDEADSTGLYNPCRSLHASLPWRLFDFGAPEESSWVPYHDLIPDFYRADALVKMGPRVRAAVPAGVFENVSVSEFESEGNFVPGGGWEEKDKYWIADGIGIIRVTGYRTEFSEGGDTQREYDLELVP